MAAAGPSRNYTLELTPLAGGATRNVNATAAEANDLCVHWFIDDLMPSTRYRYRIVGPAGVVADDPAQMLATAPRPDAPGRVRLAVSSCAKEEAGSRAVWNRIAAEEPDAVVLLGDTPYIDSTALERQTQRHREFAAVAEYQRLLRARPCWWTWDDHDFGVNNCNGLMIGKENSRLAYTRYRPQAGYGDGRNGIYTSFRNGPVELLTHSGRRAGWRRYSREPRAALQIGRDRGLQSRPVHRVSDSRQRNSHAQRLQSRLGPECG